MLFGQTNLISQGGERKIVGSLPGEQTSPRATINATNGFLVWQDNSVTTLGPRIKAQRLDANLNAAGASITVSSAWKSKTTGEQCNPRVALLPNGGAIVVWEQAGVGKSLVGQIYARFISPAGLPILKDIRVGTSRKNNQIDPAVAVLADGSVMVVWSSLEQDGSLQGIFAQRLLSNGKKLGAEFQVNQGAVNNQRNPAISALTDGRSVVAWVSELQPGRGSSSVDVFARFIGSSGTPVGNEFPINLTTSNACANPALAALPGGGFAAAWSQRDDVIVIPTPSSQPVRAASALAALSSKGWDIYARIIAADGTGSPEVIRLNTETYGDQYQPKLASLNGSFVAVWTSLGQDGSHEGVYGQLVSNEGDLEGSEFRVNTITLGRQIQPAVSADGGNRCLTVWSSYGTGTGFDLIAKPFLQASGQ